VSITLFKRDVKPRLWRYNIELSCAAASSRPAWDSELHAPIQAQF
jgi:hypothetical protein